MQQIAHFKFNYPATGQAPDAILERAENDARQKFLRPDDYFFSTVYDTYPEEEPEPGTIDVLVLVQKRPPSWFKRVFKGEV